jgi:hypothetical protein
VTLTTMLTCTTHPPTRGVLLGRLPETDRPQIVWIHIVKLVGHPPLLLMYPAGMDAVYPLSRVMAWAGPIPEPEAPL